MKTGVEEQIVASVIVPVYNSEAHLRRCLDSLLSQEIQNFEVLLVDDGSEDESERIYREYVNRIPGFSYFRRNHAGVAVARNYGIERAKGKYLLFVDSDDHVSPGFVRDMVTALEFTDSDIGVCNYYECDIDKGIQEKKVYDLGQVSLKKYLQSMLLKPVHNYYGVCWNKIFKREIVQEHNLRFPIEMSYGEDFVFVMHYLYFCKQVCMMNEACYYYTYRKNATTNSNRPKMELFITDLSRIYASYRKLWIDIGMYGKYKKAVQYYGMKIYFDEILENQQIRDERLKGMAYQTILRENGISGFDLSLYQSIRGIKRLAKGSSRMIRKRKYRVVYAVISVAAVVIIIAVCGLAVIQKAAAGGRVFSNSEISGATQTDSNWRLVWSDEFDGNELDQKVWNYDVGKDKWGNNELEYYTEGDNLRVSDGMLTITAEYDLEAEDMMYTSSRITTREKISICYGKIEARIKIPTGQGIWPAFWMMGSANDYMWPACGEIDIMESINMGNACHGYLHWGLRAESEETPGQVNGYLNQSAGTYTALSAPEEWHTYAIIWNQDEIQWLLDGQVFNTYQFDQADENQKVFQEPFYLLLNVAVGGDWPGEPDNSIFPASMYVDYVRVYDWKEE